MTNSLSRDTLRDLLLLVGKNIPTELLESWTSQMLDQAEKWAVKEFLNASDNHVKRIPMPEFLAKYSGAV